MEVSLSENFQSGLFLTLPSYCRSYKYFGYVISISLFVVAATFLVIVLSTAKRLSTETSRPHGFVDESQVSATHASVNDRSAVSTVGNGSQAVGRRSTLHTKIKELRNLVSIPSWVNSLIIEPDEDEDEGGARDEEWNAEIHIRVTPHVKTLDVQTGISWTTLHSLLEVMPNLNHLSVDMSGSCDAGRASDVQNINVPEPVKADLVEILQLTHAIEECGIFSELLARKHSRLQHLIIYHSNFTPESCRLLETDRKSVV